MVLNVVLFNMISSLNKSLVIKASKKSLNEQTRTTRDFKACYDMSHHVTTCHIMLQPFGYNSLNWQRNQ